MEKIKLNSCFQISKKIPVSQIEITIENISKLLINNNDINSEFLQKSEHPLPICKEDSLGEFIKSEFNNEGDSYRSPWSNRYFPDVELPKYPPSELRELEIIFNRLFKEYTRLYYGDKAVSSVYIWEQGESIESGFSCALLVKNFALNYEGEWDTINVVNVKFYKEKEKNVERIKVFYKLNSTVIFKINIKSMGVNLSGSLSKQIEENHYIKSYLENDFHIEKIGKLVETCENNLKNQIDEIYMKKTTEVKFLNI
jgi:capping protein (actin filament) muscle Z-line, beta